MEPGKRLPGKVAIVTGGASGIGQATARIFANHGASVVLCDLQDELGARVSGEVVAAGGIGEYRHLDVTREDDWTSLVRDIEAKYGRIDVLCNVAGIAGGIDAASGKKARMELPGLSLDSWNQVMAVNAAGVFLGTRMVHAAMKRAGGGSIINISSICGIVGSFGNAAYNASKRGRANILKVGGPAICEGRNPRELRASRFRRNASGGAWTCGQPRQDADGRHAAGPIRQAVRHCVWLPLSGVRRGGLDDRQ
jgi:NAD(P)-dependent dehydrogenase (short-subunit alcohol dehydrogenase family)